MAKADSYVNRITIIRLLSGALLALADERDWTAAALIKEAHEAIQAEQAAALESRRWERSDPVANSADTELFG